MRSLLHPIFRRLNTWFRPRLKPVADISASPPPLRIGLVGLGAIGKLHARVLSQHEVCRLRAIVCRDASRRSEVEDMGAEWFSNTESLFASGRIDAVLIATPHSSHVDLARSALQHGLHVLCEKPLAMTAVETDRLAESMQKSDKVLAVVFQHRASAAFAQMKALLSTGQLGRLLRVEVLETFPRDSAYYASAAWRGTYAGEGGGVLVNQAPHVLDRYVWLFGLPSELCALTDTRAHEIEVEDTASLLLRHSDGLHGTISVTTAPSPALSTVSILAENGVLHYSDGILTSRRKGPQGQWTATEAVAPGLSTEAMLSRLYDNFACAAAGLDEPWVSFDEARRSLHMTDAAYLSVETGTFQPVPANREELAALVARRRA